MVYAPLGATEVVTDVRQMRQMVRLALSCLEQIRRHSIIVNHRWIHRESNNRRRSTCSESHAKANSAIGLVLSWVAKTLMRIAAKTVHTYHIAHRLKIVLLCWDHEAEAGDVWLLIQLTKHTY